MTIRTDNAAKWLQRLDAISNQHVHPRERDHHEVQVRENREAALRDLAAARIGADAEELAVIDAAVAKIEGKAEAKPAQTTTTVSKARILLSLKQGRRNDYRSRKIPSRT
jgi:hypothetical protein